MRRTIIPYDIALPQIPGRNPYTKPNAYLHKLGEGNYEVQTGRRPSSMFLVEKLRVAVDGWRKIGYPKLSSTTQRLFQYWFEEDHLLGNLSFRYYWAQREALEAEIDQRVYHLYGLTAEEIAIVEGAVGK